ncbi:unnamed protein product [Alopecurus aequalis]
MATNERIRSTTDTPPATDSRADKTQMALVVHQSPSWPDNGSSTHLDDSEPLNEERAIVVAQPSTGVDEYVPPPPLRIVRPDQSLKNGKEKFPGFHYEEGAMKKATTKKTSTCLTYKRRRGRPAASMSAKSNTEQKPALFDSSSGSSSCSKGEKDDDFKPPTPARKRRRPSRFQSAKRKMEQEPLLVDSSCSEGEKDKDHEYEPEVSDDDGWRKYARVKCTAWDRAEEVKKKLPTDGPSFVKCMTHSQVVKGFWLGLPAGFCRNNLPDDDVDIVLEDEEGQTCKTKYKANNTGLSGGWAGFAKQHDLKIGDAVVFHLVEPTRFKVYIMRENKFTTIDGALGLLSLNSSMDNNTTSKKEDRCDKDTTKSKKVPRKKEKKVPEVVDGLIDLIGTPSSKMEETEGYKKLKLEQARLAKNMREIESRLYTLKEYLKEMDVEMEKMVEASAKKKKDRGCAEASDSGMVIIDDNILCASM